MRYKAPWHSPAGSRIAQPCPIESSSASEKWYEAPTHPFVAQHVVHEPLKATLRMSFDPIIRWQRVLTLNNQPRLGPGSVFSSLSSPPTHCIFTSGLGYWMKQREIAFVLLPLCLFEWPRHQLVLSGEESSASLHSRGDTSLPLSPTPTRALCQGPLRMASPELCLSSAWDVMMYSVLPTVKRGLCLSKALVFSIFPYFVFIWKTKQRLEELYCNPSVIFWNRCLLKHSTLKQ